MSCRALFLISLSLILYSNCSCPWILLDLVLRIMDRIVFLSSILLHVSVDRHVLSVFLRYPRVFFAVLQYTSLIWFHFPSTCGSSGLFSAQNLDLLFISTTNAFSGSYCWSLGMVCFVGLFFLAGAFLRHIFILDITS